MLAQTRIGLGALALSTLVAMPQAFAESGEADVSATWGTGLDAEVDYGVGLRGRYVGVPRGVLELFVEEASSGVAHPAGGLELIRRRGGFELILGFEMESLSPENGLWLDKGSTLPADTPDQVEFEDFGWVTADLTVVWHTPLHERFGLRYGAGFGLGVIRGEILRTDTECTGETTDSCEPVSGPEEGKYREAEDLPPVFPVVGALFGAQYRPLDPLSINLEVGLRSVAYAGTSVSYFF